MACHLTTADFANQKADGPFLDANWKCRASGCGKVPAEHPRTIVAAVQPGNYFKSFEFIEPFPSHFSYLYIIFAFDKFYLMI
jgi:hypothetical protein